MTSGMIDLNFKSLENKIVENGSNENEFMMYEQYVQDVADFSSQYGSDLSISYTAYNIIGKPSKFPDYGDFPQAFVMRTYGKWWQMAPSIPKTIMPQNLNKITSQDYIDLVFEQAVYPLKVSIYEIYNPGSVVRIWAGDGAGIWKILWEGEPQNVGHNPRIFTPLIKFIDFPTCLIRLEFDHSQLDYYTEIDAVLLAGTKTPISESKSNIIQTESSSFSNGSSSSVHLQLTKQIQDQIENLEIRGISNEEIPNALTSLNALAQHYINILEDLNSIQCEQTDGVFSKLPDETIINILSYLDIRSLSFCARLNKHFNSLAKDTLLYKELNFKPYWHKLTAGTLLSLTEKCKHLQKIDLSWCGNYGQISSCQFNKFLNQCGRQLVSLKLDSCKWVNDSCIKQISECCEHLKELSLKNCCKINNGFVALKNIKTLERLDLYRTSIETVELVDVLKVNPNLKHINLGSCIKVWSMDQVAQALGTYNRQLVSIDCWKTYTVTPQGVKALANCSNLEEIDLGWCLGVSIPGDSLISLAKGCPKLKKIFLAALRGITDRDLVSLIENCPNLEQIDLVGVRGITHQICYRFLTSCKNLKLFDISFCDQVQEDRVEIWRRQFPNVKIKRSFQAETAVYPFFHY